MYWPALHIDDMADYAQLENDCPPAERPHGFLILFKGKVVSWYVNIKDFIYRQDVPGVHDTVLFLISLLRIYLNLCIH